MFLDLVAVVVLVPHEEQVGGRVVAAQRLAACDALPLVERCAGGHQDPGGKGGSHLRTQDSGKFIVAHIGSV